MDRHSAYSLIGPLASASAGCGGTDRSMESHGQALALETVGEGSNVSRVADLPDPARRFLTRAIEPGTPPARSVDSGYARFTVEFSGAP